MRRHPSFLIFILFFLQGYIFLRRIEYFSPPPFIFAYFPSLFLKGKILWFLKIQLSKNDFNNRENLVPLSLLNKDSQVQLSLLKRENRTWFSLFNRENRVWISLYNRESRTPLSLSDRESQNICALSVFNPNTQGRLTKC